MRLLGFVILRYVILPAVAVCLLPLALVAILLNEILEEYEMAKFLRSIKK